MSASGMEELITRSSLNSVRHVSQVSNYLRETLNTQPTDDRNWWWGYLRRQFKLKNLEELYLKYLQRLHLGYFSVFAVLQTLLSLSHAGVLFWTTDKPLPDAVVYCVMMVSCWPFVLIVFRERLVNSYPWISLLVSCMVVLILIVVDLGLPLYHTNNHSSPKVVLRPAYTTHTLIVCYVFLPLTENIQAVILGLVVSICHLLTLGTVTYRNEDARLFERLTSDTVYILCVNGLGLYFRLMSEVAVRRTFLDRRACLESNSKVEYEKQQEENLMLSIIPRHIIDDVRRDIQSLIQHINTPLRRKPFSDMYVTEHDNVTILYADVVKYASLTVSLPVNKLVETLNELFGRFDEASEEHGVLRIKFLGDCYYCVSGVPESNPHHARNCVDLGLDMIAIIKEVREDRKLTEALDMRIGIHSGKILSGLLGVCKWQYDVWSRDVIIANSMEQAGKPFLQQPDPLFKFYVGCTLMVLLGMIIIQCLGLPSSHWIPWVGYGVSVGVILVLLPLTWTHYIWNKYEDPHEEQDYIPEPRNKLLRLLYRASLRVVWSAGTRTVLYLVICISLTVCTTLELIECDYESSLLSSNTVSNTSQAYVEKEAIDCLAPWHITQTCSLTLIMSFLFLRIHFQLKLIVGILIVCIYSWGVWILSPNFFQDGETWNPFLEPRIAHILNVTFVTITLHLLDRQAEYMNRLDYKWKRQLSKEQDESSTMHMINKMLLQNILPLHVDFALWDDNSLEGANELGSIKLLNQIICDFDKLLFDTSSLRVEKIKVAGWTYMAACGLDPGRRDSVNSINRDSYSDHVVLVLTRFAAKMMGVLESINRETFQAFKLRIGISHGNVTAGVIGAQKPHYDIWGHSVNMASRMESTGEPGKIQVTENTAMVLQELGICCDYRGEIKVKSMTNLVPTYYVHFDKNFQLICTDGNSETYSEDSENSTKL